MRHHRLRFQTKHLLFLMTFVAIGIIMAGLVIDFVGSRCTIIEITDCTPAGSAFRQVGYAYVYHSGAAQSAVPIPAFGSSIDYSKLVGEKFVLRYRDRRTLWLPPENPHIAAYRLIKTEVERYARANDD